MENVIEKQQIDRPKFSIGVIFRLLETLPDFKSKDFCDKSIYKISSSKISKLKSFEEDFLSQRVTYENISYFCHQICDVLIEHESFCKNNRVIMENFMTDELRTIAALDKDFRKSDLVQDYIEYPFFIKSTGNAESDEKEFFARFYESIYHICFMAIEAENNMENHKIALGKWEWLCDRIKAAYKDFAQGEIATEKELWLRIVTNNKFDLETRGEPIDKQKQQRRRAIAHDVVGRIFPQNSEYMNLAEDLLADAKTLRIDAESKTNTQEKRVRNFLLPDRETPIKFPYNELIACDGNLPELTMDRFNITFSDQAAEIPEEMEPLHINRDKYVLNLKISSLRNGYKPVSYRKVHINRLVMGITDPGFEENYRYEMDVAPLKYFDHCMVRGYLRGDPKFGGDLNTENDIKLRRKYDADIHFNVADGMTDNLAFYLLAGCGVWVVSSDGYLMVSLRKRVYEKPNCIGYSAAGSCEFSKRLDKSGILEEREANPFLTAKRELFEECTILADPDELKLVSFGIDYERYLQQFSFYYRSKSSIAVLLDLAGKSISSKEQLVFPVPFSKESITKLIETYEMEPGAAVSLCNIAARYC